MANVQAVNAQSWTSEVETAQVPVVVDFTAGWCPPCRALAPVLESVAGQYAGRVKVVKVDVDQEGLLASRFGVSSIPNLLFFKDGQVVNQTVGYQNEAQLKATIDKVLRT